MQDNKYISAEYQIDDLTIVVRHPASGEVIARGEIIDLDLINNPTVKNAFQRLIAVGDLIPAPKAAATKNKGSK